MKNISHNLINISHADTPESDPCTLQVTGFKKGTSMDMLELYFESKRKPFESKVKVLRAQVFI